MTNYFSNGFKRGNIFIVRFLYIKGEIIAKLAHMHYARIQVYLGEKTPFLSIQVDFIDTENTVKSFGLSIIILTYMTNVSGQ